MTVPKVEIGFEGPARATAFQLDDPTYGVLDTGVLGIGELLVDLSDRLTSISIQRGRTEDTEPAQTGRASITLRNRDGVLDPLNTASFLYPGVEPRRTVKVWADNQQVFQGFVDDIDLAYTPDGGADVIVHASDGLGRLALADLGDGVVVSEQDSGARISAILSARPSLWAGATDIDTGDSTLAAGTANGNALDYMKQVTRSEAGYLFIARDGDLTFRNRNNPAQNPDNLTLSDAGGTACTAYEVIERTAGVDDLYNSITATYAGTDYTATDADSVDDYGPRNLNLGELLLNSVASVEDRLDYELSRRSQPLTRVRRITVNQSKDTCLKTLRQELGQAITIIFTPPSVAQQTQEAIIISIGHLWSVGQPWRTSFGLINRDALPFFILDDVTYGVLNTGTLAF